MKAGVPGFVGALLLARVAGASDAGPADPGAEAGVPAPSPVETLWVPPATVVAAPLDPERSRALYDNLCRSCHGRDGRGDGSVASTLSVRPADLTLGVFKVRSTPTGSLPSDLDLFATITQGLPGAMPGFGGLTVADRWQLVQLVKSLSRRFEHEPVERVLMIVRAQGGDVERGREVYRRLECSRCHGEDGRAVGPPAPIPSATEGKPIATPNLRRAENFRGGCSPEALYRTLFTGLDGTPMPSYAAALVPETARDLVAYLRSLLARPADCRR